MIWSTRRYLLKISIIVGILLASGWLTQPIAAQGLPSDGAWLVYLTSTTNNPNVLDQVVAINADATSSMTLAEGRSYFQLSTSKLGYVAFLSADMPANANYYQNLRLTVIQLPDGKLIKELPLTNADTAVDPKADAGTDFPSYSITDVASITVDNVEIASMSWSPDGKTLAYMGGELGPSIDLYTYQPETDTVRQLTDGPTQSVRPVWSPDGKYIVHMGVSGLGTGAGYGVVAMYTAFADDSGKVLLTYGRPAFNDLYSGDEIIVGWRNKVTFWVATWTPQKEFAYLRSVNPMGDTTMIWDENFRGAAADSQSGTVVISKNEFHASDVVTHGPGLYLYTADGQIKQLSTEDNFGRVVWSPTTQRYYVEVQKENYVVAVTSDGVMTELPISTLPKALKAGDSASLVWLEGTRLMITAQTNDGSLAASQQLAPNAYEFAVVCSACG